MKRKVETKKTSDAVAILDSMAGGRPDLRRLTEDARVSAAVAQLIYAGRNQAGLSQAELLAHSANALKSDSYRKPRLGAGDAPVRRFWSLWADSLSLVGSLELAESPAG